MSYAKLQHDVIDVEKSKKFFWILIDQKNQVSNFCND